MQCCNRITPCSTYQCGIIITASSDSLSVPCVGQLCLADGDSLLAGYIWINDKMKCCNRIATDNICQCSIIITCDSDALIVPDIRQLSLADRNSFFTGYN